MQLQASSFKLQAESCKQKAESQKQKAKTNTAHVSVQHIKNKKRWVFNYSAFSILTGIL